MTRDQLQITDLQGGPEAYVVSVRFADQLVVCDVRLASSCERSFATVGEWAISYRGAEGAAATSALCELLKRDGVAALVARFAATSTTASQSSLPRCLGGPERRLQGQQPPKPCRACLDQTLCDTTRAPEFAAGVLRPRVSNEPLVDVFSLWAELGQLTPEAVSSAVELRRGGTATAVYELSVKLDQSGLRGARLTRYHETNEVEPAFASFERLAGFDIASRVRVVDDLQYHVGFSHTPAGRITKLYVTSDGLPAATARRAFQTFLRPLQEVDWLASERDWAWLALDAKPDGSLGVRAYERVKPQRHRADACMRAWEWGASAPAAHYALYFSQHLTWADVVAELRGPADILERIGRAFSVGNARYYVRVLADGSQTQTIYAHVGPYAPASLA